MSKTRPSVVSLVQDVRTNSGIHTWALWRPSIVHGYLPHREHGRYQKIFFDALLKNGFKRTRWQFVLPGQTAGLVKRVPKHSDGVSQYHVRFHEDGSIECEAERHNFDMRHWSGTRYRSVGLLENILKDVEVNIEPTAVAPIRKLFDVKWDGCLDLPVRSHKKKN